MIVQLFWQYLIVFITTSVIIVLIGLSARFWRQWPAKLKYAIWLVIAIRLLLPFQPQLKTAPVKIEVISPPAAGQQIQMQPSDERKPSDMPNNAQNAPLPVDTNTVAACIWLVGGALIFLYEMGKYTCFWHKVRRWSTKPANPSTQQMLLKVCSELGCNVPQLYICRQEMGPMTMGLFHPILVLPHEKYSQEQLYFILRHEILHIQRKDLWYKRLLLLVRIIHWYHPLVYWWFQRANIDLEFACDEAVVQNLNFDKRCAYSNVILSSAAKKAEAGSAFSTYFYAEVKTLKERFSNILTAKRRKKGVLLLSLVVLCTVLVSTLVACTPAVSEPSGSPSSGEDSTQNGAADLPSSVPITSSGSLSSEPSGTLENPYYIMTDAPDDGAPYGCEFSVLTDHSLDTLQMLEKMGEMQGFVFKSGEMPYIRIQFNGDKLPKDIYLRYISEDAWQQAYPIDENWRIEVPTQPGIYSFFADITWEDDSKETAYWRITIE